MQPRSKPRKYTICIKIHGSVHSRQIKSIKEVKQAGKSQNLKEARITSAPCHFPRPKLALFYLVNMRYMKRPYRDPVVLGDERLDAAGYVALLHDLRLCVNRERLALKRNY
jgi:hypothetical protein